MKGCKILQEYTRRWRRHYSQFETIARNKRSSSSVLILTTAAMALNVSLADEDKKEEGKAKKIYRREEVEKHRTMNRGVWMTYQDGVYDVTNYLRSHPGGTEKLLMAGGEDLASFWKLVPFQQHYQSPMVFELLEDMKIGTLHPNDVISLTKDDWERRTRQYSEKEVYDCIVIGAGVSGLQAAHALVQKQNIDAKKVLVLEAHDYIGGRVRQTPDFIKGINVELGGEFLHGSNTALTAFATAQNEPLSQMFVWAAGDGGPLEEPMSDGGYGLYYFKERGLLRFDSKNKEFVRMNKILWDLCFLDMDEYSDDVSLYDYLKGLDFSEEMMTYAEAGFANTLCATAKGLSLRQCIQWQKLWHEEEKANEKLGYDSESDFVFNNSFKVLLDYLSKDIQIELGTAVKGIDYPIIDGASINPAHNRDVVKVTATNGTVYSCKTVIVTSSPHVLRSGMMQFNPPLPGIITDALQTVNMSNTVKVLMKFSDQVWPKDLQGMICTDNDALMPELWFINCAEKVHENEPTKAYAVGLCSAEYADKIASLPRSEAMFKCVEQLDTMFSLLEPQHMVGELKEIGNAQSVSELKKPSDAFIGGTFWDWNKTHHPYIGGGYCSPKAGTPAWKIKALAEPVGVQMFFAGESTIVPGTCIHAAMDSGVRAAKLAAIFLNKQHESSTSTSTSTSK